MKKIYAYFDTEKIPQNISRRLFATEAIICSELPGKNDTTRCLTTLLIFMIKPMDKLGKKCIALEHLERLLIKIKEGIYLNKNELTRNNYVFIQCLLKSLCNRVKQEKKSKVLLLD